MRLSLTTSCAKSGKEHDIQAHRTSCECMLSALKKQKEKKCFINHLPFPYKERQFTSSILGVGKLKQVNIKMILGKETGWEGEGREADEGPRPPSSPSFLLSSCGAGVRTTSWVRGWEAEACHRAIGGRRGRLSGLRC